MALSHGIMGFRLTDAQNARPARSSWRTFSASDDSGGHHYRCPPFGRQRPMPTTLSRRITLNGTPNNHMITDDMLSPSIRYNSMSHASLKRRGPFSRKFAKARPPNGPLLIDFQYKFAGLEASGFP